MNCVLSATASELSHQCFSGIKAKMGRNYCTGINVCARVRVNICIRFQHVE